MITFTTNGRTYCADNRKAHCRVTDWSHGLGITRPITRSDFEAAHTQYLAEPKTPSMLEWIEDLMEATGCDWETAAREWDYLTNPDYSADDYDG